MAKPLDFKTIPKQYLTVTLPDEKGTTLLIGTPNKKLMDDLMVLQTTIDRFDENTTDTESFNELFDACAKIMSRNKANIEITKEMLEEIFDLEDIMIFFNAYMGFIDEVSGSKN